MLRRWQDEKAMGLLRSSVNRCACSGGIKLRVLLAALTLVILGAAVVVLVRSYQRDLRVHHREALQVSEDGLLRALQKLQREPSWSEGFGKTEHPNGWYKVTMSLETDRGEKEMTVASEGHSGPAVRRQISVLHLKMHEGDSVWVQQSITQE